MRLGMKRLMLPLCLIGVGTVSIAPACDLAMSTAFSSPQSCIQLREIVDPQPEQAQVHAVVVDMPAVISLSYASPDTWGELPMPVRPYEQPPVMVPEQQLASVSD
jgi:hypothetical protein